LTGVYEVTAQLVSSMTALTDLWTTLTARTVHGEASTDSTVHIWRDIACQWRSRKRCHGNTNDDSDTTLAILDDELDRLLRVTGSSVGLFRPNQLKPSLRLHAVVG